MSAYVTWLMCLRNVVRRSAHTRSEIKKYRIAIREQVLIVLVKSSSFYHSETRRTIQDGRTLNQLECHCY